MQTHTIHTERLALRSFTPESYRAASDNMNDTELASFLGADEKDLPREREKYERLLKANVAFVVFTLAERATGNALGSCAYHTRNERHHRAEIGYMINDPDRRGKGYMKEALPCILTYGFEQMGLNRIEACTAPWNTASRRLLESMGFREEGLMKQHYLREGVYEDSLMYALLRGEYRISEQ